MFACFPTAADLEGLFLFNKRDPFFEISDDVEIAPLFIQKMTDEVFLAFKKILFGIKIARLLMSIN